MNEAARLSIRIRYFQGSAFAAGQWSWRALGSGSVLGLPVIVAAITAHIGAFVLMARMFPRELRKKARKRRWRLLGAMEAMNGAILFGLTAAFLFASAPSARPDRES
ncbi:hypothetical protein [Methylocystis parvus]|uniref:Uncharacterized protein n=1 Tax=Methylocystis parvus TaxID=134 RepID=A0A6B8M7S2_9HYPH|nr:hypothetical protein [Methylocystis parvus]QGM96790.1 hypothetical protein F7D14_04415 [Methylocystis parvus]WBJ99333.1 hypothetical protein MMG94_15210 [Methylocystis parvus OBBP]